MRSPTSIHKSLTPCVHHSRRSQAPVSMCSLNNSKIMLFSTLRWHDKRQQIARAIILHASAGGYDAWSGGGLDHAQRLQA